jgi:hypothetical protein
MIEKFFVINDFIQEESQDYIKPDKQKKIIFSDRKRRRLLFPGEQGHEKKLCHYFK